MSATDPIRPPIPTTCEHRPTTGGLVIPWVNVQLADGGVDFRAKHTTREQQCWTEVRCQVCATPIQQPPIVLLGGPQQLESLMFDEPPLHPECAAYVTHACPMVNGRQQRFADRVAISDGRRGKACPEPGCDCGGWIPTPGTSRSAGGPAHPWYAVYVTGYSLGVTRDQPNLVAVGVVHPTQIRAVRHVSTPGEGRTWTRTTLEQVRALTNQEVT